MNRTPRTQPIPAMGFAAQVDGLSRSMRVMFVELLTPSQAGAAATK